VVGWRFCWELLSGCVLVRLCVLGRFLCCVLLVTFMLIGFFVGRVDVLLCQDVLSVCFGSFGFLVGVSWVVFFFEGEWTFLLGIGQVFVVCGFFWHVELFWREFFFLFYLFSCLVWWVLILRFQWLACQACCAVSFTWGAFFYRCRCVVFGDLYWLSGWLYFLWRLGLTSVVVGVIWPGLWGFLF